MPQTELVLRKLEDLLREDKITPELQRETGMTKEEMEQFVQKFKGAPKAAPGTTREIELGPAEDRETDPNRPGPAFRPGSTFSTRSSRGAGSVPQDDERGLVEGIRSQAPPEIRSRWEAYKSGISRSASGSPKAAPAPGSNR